MDDDDEQTALRNRIPEPEDDGEADHLVGNSVPSVALPATDGTIVDLSDTSGTVIVYCFPKMGRTAAEPDPDGWEAIPGAYGCTEEACSFRDHYQELVNLGVAEVFGLSLQSSDHQQDAHARVEPPYEFLSDSERVFTDKLRLPTFEVEGVTFNKRLTLVLEDGEIDHVFYPVFPPDEHAEEVIRWLETSYEG
jgi:peroxiredoxin